MVDEVEEEASHVERGTRKFAERGGKWRAAQAAGRGDVLGQMNRIHTATRQRLMWVLHQP